MGKVIIGKILKHNGDGTGFKLSFDNPYMAEVWKDKLEQLFKLFLLPAM